MANWTASQFRNQALSLVGLPYVLGAEVKWPARPKALDCSELVEWLYDGNGTPIGDLAASQYDKASINVARGKEQVGDLIFLKNNGARWNGIGHVAVLTAKLSNGDWEIVEAKGRAYGVVRTTLSFWRTRSKVTGVRRYPKFKLKASSTSSSAGDTTTKPLVSRVTKVTPKKSINLPVKIQQEIVGTKADGIRGPKTIAAIKSLQKRLKVTSDGVWGPATGRAYLLSLPNLHDKTSGQTAGIKYIQWLGGVTADGKFGPNTKAAVQGMQAWAGLTTDGNAGPTTKRAVIR